MSITKKFVKSNKICKVGFRLESEASIKAENAYIVGDFNDWNQAADPMKKLKNGSFTATLDLETGKEYQFRYLIDGVIWENDDTADKYLPTAFGDSENSVLVL